MYVKLFSSLYQGTLRGRSDEILVFTNLLAHADQYGVVDKHWKAIAEETGLTRERVEEAINSLEQPDPESRSPEMNGCRIIRLDEHRAWGWKIVNYGKYRSIRNEDDRREQNRLAQERYRNKHSKPPSSHTDTDTDTDTDTEAEKENNNTIVGLTPSISPQEKKNGHQNTADAIEVLNFLNTKTGRNYRPKDATGKPTASLQHIINRLKTGVSVQDCKTVIARKHRDWAGNDKMWPYLRPATLFNATKFEQYLGECVIDDPQKRRIAR